MRHRRMFHEAAVPDIRDLQGEYAVRLLTPFLPAIRFFGQKKHFPANVAEQGGGTNIFVGRIRLGRFRIERGESSLGDGLEVVKIIYDHPSNPKLLQWLTDEVREHRPGHYICRGIYRFFGRPVNTMYFTLERL